jgi:hypothetical protein
VREDAQVKLSGFFGVVVEPEEWRKFVHSWHGTSQEVNSGEPTCGTDAVLMSELAMIHSSRIGGTMASVFLGSGRGNNVRHESFNMFLCHMYR